MNVEKCPEKQSQRIAQAQGIGQTLRQHNEKSGPKDDPLIKCKNHSSHCLIDWTKPDCRVATLLAMTGKVESSLGIPYFTGQNGLKRPAFILVTAGSAHRSLFPPVIARNEFTSDVAI